MVLSKDLKFAICFGLIIGVIISLCGLCFASEEVVDDIDSIDGLVIGNDGLVRSSANNNIYYITIEPGYKYTFTNSASARTVGFSNDLVSFNYQFEDFTTVDSNGVYSFDGGSVGYLYFNCSYSNVSYVNITREKLGGMDDFIDNIAYSLSLDNIGSVWVIVVPMLAISVLFGLGYYFIKRIMNKTKRAKGGM